MDSHSSSLRGGAPVRRRIACEVAAGGQLHKGVASELAPHAIRIQLGHDAIPERGAEVAIRLRDATIGPEPLEVRAVVSRQTPDDGEASGFEARIVEAAPEYHGLFGAGPYDDTTEVEILVEVGGSAGPVGPAVTSSPLGSPLGEASATWPEPAPDERDLPTSKVPGSLGAPSRPGADEDLPERRRRAAAGVALDETAVLLPPEAPESAAFDETDVDFEPWRDFERSTPARETPTDARRAPEAIAVYEGDKLDDVFTLLMRLGARPERARTSGPTRFRGWDRPPRVLVADAQDALSIDWPENLIADGVVRIAVASSSSSALGKTLRRQGFHYLVRRPVHEKALEVLLRRALHAGNDRRDEGRAPLGLDARLATGAWRWPAACTVLELSAVGCRLATLEDIPLLSPVRLRINRRASGSRSVSLRARVVRRRRDEASGEWLIALRFLEVAAEQRGRLDGLLTRTAIGPTSTLVESPPTRLARRIRRMLGRGGDAATEEAPTSPEPAPEVVPPRSPMLPERRAVSRGAMDREVVALDTDRQGVTAVLTGRDLSTLGMRVDPHPEFSVGRRVVVAFFDWVSRGTIEIAAEVVRDDGDRGMGIRFVDMDADSAARLEQLVASLPAVESLGPRSRTMMVARIVASDETAAPKPLAPATTPEPTSLPVADSAESNASPLARPIPSAAVDPAPLAPEPQGSPVLEVSAPMREAERPSLVGRVAVSTVVGEPVPEPEPEPEPEPGFVPTPERIRPVVSSSQRVDRRARRNRRNRRRG